MLSFLLSLRVKTNLPTVDDQGCKRWIFRYVVTNRLQKYGKSSSFLRFLLRGLFGYHLGWWCGVHATLPRRNFTSTPGALRDLQFDRHDKVIDVSVFYKCTETVKMTILFREVSFTSPPQWSSNYCLSTRMDDPVSPLSIRERTPSTGESSLPACSAEVTMAELSNRFHHHTIEPRPYSYYSDAHQSHRSQYNVSKPQKLGSPSHNQQFLRRRRQSASRLQCSPACLEQIATLVEDIMKDRDSYTAQPHRSPSCISSQSYEDEHIENYPTLPRWPSLPTLSSTSTITPSSPLSEDFEPDLNSSSPRCRQAFKICKEPSHRQISRRRAFVEKEVRVRRRAICYDQ